MIDSAWEQFPSAELEQKLMVLRELIESCMLTARSAEHKLREIGIIESELVKHHGGLRLCQVQERQRRGGDPDRDQGIQVHRRIAAPGSPARLPRHGRRR